ncbi:hypothetical protein Dsin_007346 [Dipteronia sinensis]|uniref:Protein DETOXIFICATION n=1 Tax=Dipteronia sinensis TaxID=43782 RepID=A0AAE0EGR8_9ROSI|nr:hypothetical protein Dsin_007346 [Dipteronia sinensis]
MCPGSEQHMITRDGDYNSEEAKRVKTESNFIQGCLRRLPVNGLRGLPLHEVGEEVMSLGKIAFPIVMTTLLIYSRSVISMLFLSHLGRVELAGGSLALGCANITGNSVIKGLSMGMDPICGQAFGAKRFHILSQVYQKTMCLLLLVCIPISLLWLNVEPIFLKLGQDPEISRVAKTYIIFTIPELVAQAALQPMRAFLRTQGLTSPLTIAAIAAVVLHLPINYIFAIQLKWGIKGVALALACNTVNLNLGLLIYVLLSKTPLKPWHNFTISSFFQGWRPLLALSVPSCVSVCLEWWWYEIMLFLCGLLQNPEASVAAMGILIQTTSLLYVFPYALSCSLTTRVGHALGARQPSRAQWTAIIGIIMAIGFGLSAAVVMTLLKSLWGKMFTEEPQILDLISAALPILGLCEIGNAPQTASCGVLTGTARPKDGVRINLFSFYIVGLPVAILMTFKFKIGFRGLWFGLLAAQISCVILMVYTMIKTDWKHQAKRAEELTLSAGDTQDLETGLISSEN